MSDKYNVSQNQSENINTNTQVINTIEKPINTGYREVSKANKLVNNLNSLFNTGMNILDVTAKKQTENALKNANEKILKKGGKLSTSQVEKLHDEVANEAGIFANIDKVGKKINSKLAVENATFDFVKLKNEVDSNWEKMQESEKKQFAGKSDYFNSVFNSYNLNTLKENEQVDTDYALKYANNLATFKDKTLLSYMAEDKIEKDKQEERKLNGTNINTLHNNSLVYSVDEKTGELVSVGNKNYKVLFNQLKDSMLVYGDSFEKQTNLLKNTIEVAKQNNNVELLEKIYNSDLLSEEVKNNYRTLYEESKAKIKAGITNMQLKAFKNANKKTKLEQFEIKEKVLKDADVYVKSGMSREEYLKYASNNGIELNIASKKYDENKTRLDALIAVNKDNKSYKELSEANPDKKNIILSEAKKEGKEIYNNIFSNILKVSNKVYTDEEIANGVKEKDLANIRGTIKLFAKKASQEDGKYYLNYAKTQSSKIYNYGEEQLQNMDTNELEQTELIFNMNEELMKNGVNILNKEQKLEHNLAKYYNNDLIQNDNSRYDSFRNSLLFATKIRSLDDTVKSEAKIMNNKTNNSDFTDFLDSLTDSETRREAKELADALSALNGKSVDVETFKEKFMSNNNISKVELDGSGYLNDDEIYIDLNGSSIVGQEDYNELVLKAREKGILEDGITKGSQQFFGTIRIGGKLHFYPINNDKTIDTLTPYSSKLYTEDELLKILGMK